MATREVAITPSVLGWAIDESGLTVTELARRLKTTDDEVLAWVGGKQRPTRGQFTKLAQELRRPSAIFFLERPPQRAGLPTSLRSAPGLLGHRLQLEEVRHVQWARRLQDVTSWALRQSGSEPVVLPSHNPQENPATVASQVREVVGTSVRDQLSWSNNSEAIRAWRAALEGLGVLVLSLSMGRGNIRGFSAFDEYAPLVAVNSAWHPTARIYTMFHELGHLVTRSDAACFKFVVPNDPSDPSIERWCESFAASFLLPEDALRAAASNYGITSTEPTRSVDETRRLANRFKVSVRATALRLQSLKLAPPTLYGAVVKAYEDIDWNPQREGGGGQATPEKRLSQLGERLPEVLLAAEERGALTRRDLTDYLNVGLGQLQDLERLISR